jgi:predicted dehydrogenase
MTLRFAIAGAGYIANYHARAIHALDDAKIIAVVEKFPEKGIPFRDCYRIPNYYVTIDEMINAGGADALVVATPNFLHLHQSMMALNAGIHVMVEKPMAMNSEEARCMLDASNHAGSYLMVAHCWRFDEEVLWLKEQIDSGKLGQIIRTKGFGVHAHWGPSGWFVDKELAGGGALVDMGVHAVDTARFLLSDPQPMCVYAKIGTYYGDYDVDDTGIILITWENGVTSLIESGWWQPHVDGPEASTQIYGSRGYGNVFPTLLEIPDIKNKRIDVINPGFPFPRDEHCPQKMYSKQMAYFADCIRNENHPNPGGFEGLVNLHILDAAYESATTGKVVKIK